MQRTDIVKKLFAWCSKNLTHEASLKKAEIGNYFADSFLVVANGKSYNANHENYFAFLNQFRSSIRNIRYDLGDLIFDPAHAVIPLRAHIVRTDNSNETFEAILILKFTRDDKIVLWHEVYVKSDPVRARSEP